MAGTIAGNVDAKGADGLPFTNRAADGNQPAQAPNGANGVDHWNGDDDPKPGADGTLFPAMRGADGAAGRNGQDGTDVILDIDGTIEGINVDARGGLGGRGQNGGNGAKGQQGGNGGNAADTGDSRAHGGKGSAGGDGGKGGDGGNGGNGGHVTIRAVTIVAASVQAHADGGDVGDAGDPGNGGPPGDPGSGDPSGDTQFQQGARGPSGIRGLVRGKPGAVSVTTRS